MVFFSCDGCAEMLKKNQVDAHASRCRKCDAVSCVDCSVSFFGGELNGATFFSESLSPRKKKLFDSIWHYSQWEYQNVLIKL
jgi:hypothetical protein